MSAAKLAQEVDFMTRRLQSKQKPPHKSASRFLINSLDPAAAQELSKLRYGKSKGDGRNDSPNLQDAP